MESTHFTILPSLATSYISSLIYTMDSQLVQRNLALKVVLLFPYYPKLPHHFSTACWEYFQLFHNRFRGLQVIAHLTRIQALPTSFPYSGTDIKLTLLTTLQDSFQYSTHVTTKRTKWSAAKRLFIYACFLRNHCSNLSIKALSL